MTKDTGTPMFDEDALGKEIARIWGEHGAHAEVYSMLRHENSELRKKLESCLAQLDSYESDDDLSLMADEGDKDSFYKLVTRKSARAALSSGRREE